MNDLLSAFNTLFTSNGDTDINPLVATALTANTMSAASATDDRMSERETKTRQAEEYTIKMGPNGEPVLHGKNMPLSNVTADRKKATLDLAARARQSLDRLGYPTEDPATAEKDVSSVGGAMRAIAKQGGGRGEGGGLNMLAGALGARFNKGARANLARSEQQRRAAEISAAYQKYAVPIENEQQQADREQRMKQSERRQLINQVLDQGVLGFGSADDAKKAIAQRLGGLQDGEAEAIDAQWRKEREAAQAKQASTVNSRITGLRDEDVRGYSPDQVDKFLADQEQDLGPLTEAQRTRLAKRFGGLHDEIKTAERKEQRAEERFTKAIAAASGSKPYKIPAWQARDLSTDSLLAAKGDESADQGSVDRALQARAGRLQQELNDVDASIAGNSAAAAEIDSIIKRGEGSERSQLERAERSRNGATLVTKRKQLVAEIGKLQGAGVILDDATERGIRAYMGAKGYGPEKRSQAIEELRKAGKL